MLQSVLLSLALASEAKAKVLVPELTGPYQVGTTVLELVDYSRQDPFAPTPQPRDLVVSLFYPTGDHTKQVKNCSLAPQFPPGTAAALDVFINNTGVAESITTRSCTGSPLSWPDLPLLLLGPGLGTSRLLYSDLAEELASQGWNLVTIDHPYDSLIVEYPDGRLVFPSDSPTVANATLDQYLDARVKDTIFVLNSLSNSSVISQIPGLGRPSSPHSASKPKLQTAKVGAFGHSFGGATALQLLKDDKRFVTGADLDGGVYGNVVQEGTDSPFLYMRASNHTHITDPTWAAAWPNLRGFKREYSVNDTTHGSFTDFIVLRDILPEGALGVYGENLGSNTGERLLEIQSAFLGALFDRFLKGHGGSLLDGKGLDHWPEVTLEGQARQ
ncbi:platelet-activating factor acetylhydrolase [Hypoxylon argillaceum]|nr:platelet-activating factor acetylhydrolase [Hypoxylon argillaceum]KAI1156370.1 platelet-activating factor acetylhydrolase [Nemania diffusa]